MENHPLVLLIGYELARQHQLELRQSEARQHTVERRPSVLRRSLARAFAALSLGSARAVRRLDTCLADDLVEGLTAGRSA
jgi:hypothetical protein